MRSSHLLSSVLGLCRQVVIGIMGLRDPAEEYGHHTWGAEQHVRLQVVKRELSCTPVVQRTECNNPRTQSNRSSESRGRAPAAVNTGRSPITPADLCPRHRAVRELACKATRFGQQERAPGHQEEQASLQQRELTKFGELGDVADG